MKLAPGIGCGTNLGELCVTFVTSWRVLIALQSVFELSQKRYTNKIHYYLNYRGFFFLCKSRASQTIKASTLDRRGENCTIPTEKIQWKLKFAFLAAVTLQLLASEILKE